MRRSALLFDSDNRPTPVFTDFLLDIQVPGDDLISIDDALQKRFFQKGPDGQPLERWELKEVESGCQQSTILHHLGRCGFCWETFPTQQEYVYAIWPGALAPRAAVRLRDLWKAHNSGIHWIKTIVLGGKRPLQPDKEGLVQCCTALDISDTRNYTEIWEKINPQTELDMMRFLWMANSIRREIFMTATFVDAPMKPPIKEGGPPVRPNTEDTINEWLRTIPATGSILLSSGAPYGMVQDETFWKVLGSLGFMVDTFGHAAPDLPIENFMREVAGCVHQIRAARLGS